MSRRRRYTKPQKKLVTTADIIADISAQCARAVQRNRSIKSKVLKTDPALLSHPIFIKKAISDVRTSQEAVGNDERTKLHD